MVRQTAHRVIVVDEEGRLLRFLTQSTILRFIGANKEKFQGLLTKTFASVGFGKPVAVFCVKQSEKAIAAFKLMSVEVRCFVFFK